MLPSGPAVMLALSGSVTPDSSAGRAISWKQPPAGQTQSPLVQVPVRRPSVHGMPSLLQLTDVLPSAASGPPPASSPAPPSKSSGTPPLVTLKAMIEVLLAAWF